MDRQELAARAAEAIKAVGGQTTVARECNVKQSSVSKWTRNGLPRTEWTGETEHSVVIERLAAEQGKHQFTRAYLLGLPEPLAVAG